MTRSIDFNTIKNGCLSAYHTCTTKASEWLGRGITIIKSGAERASPYLQDKRIAAISVVAVNLILIEIGLLFSLLIDRCLPKNTDFQRAFTDLAQIAVSTGTVVGGVVAFTKLTKPPLNFLTITLISLATIGLRAALTD